MTRCEPRTATSALQDGVVGGAGAVEQLAGRVAALLGEGQQQVLGGDEFVLEMAGFVEGALQHLVERLREIHAGLASGGLGQVAKQAPGLGDDGIRMHAAFFQHRPDDAFPFFGQRNQQVQRKHHLAFAGFRNGLRLLQGLLRFLRQFVDPKHNLVPKTCP